jgi:hypothetical protein
MHVLLPVAGISISAPLLIAAGGLIGVLCGLLGVGGGFLLTPMLITIGLLVMLKMAVSIAMPPDNLLKKPAGSVAMNIRHELITPARRGASLLAAAAPTAPAYGTARRRSR